MGERANGVGEDEGVKAVWKGEFQYILCTSTKRFSEILVEVEDEQKCSAILKFTHTTKRRDVPKKKKKKLKHNRTFADIY